MNKTKSITKIVKSSSLKGFNIPAEFGKNVIIHIFPFNEENESYDLMKLQEESGFMKQIIMSEDEDVWNDL